MFISRRVFIEFLNVAERRVVTDEGGSREGNAGRCLWAACGSRLGEEAAGLRLSAPAHGGQMI